MFRCVLCIALLLCAATSCLALEHQSGETIAYRQSVFRVIRWNVGYLAEMASGRADWDTAAFARRAARVAALARQLDDAFAPGSDQGAFTDAKPEIWSNADDFAERLRAFQTEARTLARTARAGDADATKAQFSKTMSTCKACHDRYRAE